MTNTLQQNYLYLCSHVFTENDKTLFNITNILKQNKYEEKRV